MRAKLPNRRSEAGRSRFTHLFACISEEDDGYTVLVRLNSPAQPQESAWGEEIADSLETASMLVAALAANFAIPPARIKIRLRMHDVAAGTRH